MEGVVAVLAIADPTVVGVTLTLGILFVAAAVWFGVFIVRKLSATPKGKG
jgi:heme A synthase